jgi:3-dehydroquinate synthase II
LTNQWQNKELIVRPALTGLALHEFIEQLVGVDLIYADPNFVTGKNFKTVFPSEKADYIVCDTIDTLDKIMKKSKHAGFYKKVNANSDVDDILEASRKGAEFVIVDATDWKIIPLENIIAKLQKSGTRIYANARDSDEVKTMFSVLELGVDGVILNTNDLKEVENSRIALESVVLGLENAKVVEVKDAGIGERVCVDTASMMTYGEGLLVGNMSNFLFLIHNESIGSSFTSPRPFRVNAGAVHCYTIIPDGTTKYLSELEAGVEVLVVNNEGISRTSTVGRSKIERRPLKLIRAECHGEIGSVIVQNAETIRLVSKDKKLIAVTDIKIGDEIMVYTKPSSGRHFGMQVDEFILEK